MEFSSQALVLRVGRFREADLWVRFLSSSRGIHTAFAFGGSKSRRRFSGCLDQLNIVHFRVKSSRTGSFLTLEEGTLLRGPTRLRQDWQRFGIAQNCLRFIEAFDVPPDSAAAAFSLATELMDCLEESDRPVLCLPPLFRGRFAFDQGYQINLSSCALCGKPLDNPNGCCFFAKEGVVQCLNCPGPPEPVFRLSAEGLDLLRSIQHTSPLSWVIRDISPPVLRECFRAIDSFIQYHIGLRWDGGRFKKD